MINGCRSTSLLTDQAAEALADYGLPIAPVRIGSRVAFVKSLAQGLGVVEFEPKGRSANEIRDLYSYTTKKGGM